MLGDLFVFSPSEELRDSSTRKNKHFACVQMKAKTTRLFDKSPLLSTRKVLKVISTIGNPAAGHH